jgi:3-hydroxyisobutyrate dehydrogenase
VEIGILGIGLMGHAFVERFSSQGHTVSVFNRSPESVKDLSKNGVIVCNTVHELISSCRTIILMLSNADAIQDLLIFDKQLNLQNKTIIQMATISPSQSIHISESVRAHGGQYLEAPVLGSIPEARTGSLIIMVAGLKEVFDRSLPILQVLGAGPRYIGETGSAAALKLSMNQLIASLTAGFSLSLGYAMKNGVDTNLFMDVVRESSLYAKTYDKKLAKYISRDFGSANFSTRHLLKDIRLFVEDAKAAGLNTIALEGIEQITRDTVEDGFALMDYSSIYRTICPDND